MHLERFPGIQVSGVPNRALTLMLRPGGAAWSRGESAQALVAGGFAPPRSYGAPGNQMFVTCGIGFSLVPVRIGAPPQVVFFELTPAE